MGRKAKRILGAISAGMGGVAKAAGGLASKLDNKEEAEIDGAVKAAQDKAGVGTPSLFKPKSTLFDDTRKKKGFKRN